MIYSTFHKKDNHHSYPIDSNQDLLLMNHYMRQWSNGIKLEERERRISMNNLMIESPPNWMSTQELKVQVIKVHELMIQLIGLRHGPQEQRVFHL